LKQASVCFRKGAALEKARGNAGEVQRLKCEAIRCFKRAADLGDVVAKNLCGKMKVNRWGGPVNMKEGIEYLAGAAQANFEAAPFTVADLFRNGKGGIPKDEKMAKRPTERANQIKVKKTAG
jgi:TPR repeat protein